MKYYKNKILYDNEPLLFRDSQLRDKTAKAIEGPWHERPWSENIKFYDYWIPDSMGVWKWIYYGLSTHTMIEISHEEAFIEML